MLYINTGNRETNFQIAQVKPLDVTAIVSSGPCGCKIPDYVLLKTDEIDIFAKNK